jgi:L-alanine-DL-glutamate epimerase-like enolase superfamily enzyme
MAERFAEFDLHFFEEPVAADCLDGYASLTARSPIPIAAGEEETTIYGFRDLAERGGIDVLQPDISRCGGFTQARRIAALAHERGVECVPHAFSTGVLVAASLHLVAAMPHGTLAEFSVADSPLVHDLLEQPFALSDGSLAVPQGPGLGIRLDASTLNRFRVA